MSTTTTAENCFITHPTISILPPVTKQTMLLRLEEIARISHNSKPESTNQSIDGQICNARMFLRRLIDRGHISILEHLYVTVTIPISLLKLILTRTELLRLEGYLLCTTPTRESSVTSSRNMTEYTVTQNVRLWMEFLMQDPPELIPSFVLLQYLIRNTIKQQLDPVLMYAVYNSRWKELALKYNLPEVQEMLGVYNIQADIMQPREYTFEIFCNRGISHELVRHRVAVTQASTRYINYENYGYMFNMGHPAKDGIDYKKLMEFFGTCVEMYNNMQQWTKQRDFAREMLPICFQTRLFMTFTLKQLKHLIELRSSKNAHPEIQELANLMKVTANV